MNARLTGQSHHTMQDIDRLAAALEATPAPERPMSKKEALNKLAPALKAARDRGHTLQGLVEQLEQQGLRTHVRAVSSAIARLSAPKAASQKRGKNKATSTTHVMATPQA